MWVVLVIGTYYPEQDSVGDFAGHVDRSEASTRRPQASTGSSFQVQLGAAAPWVARLRWVPSVCQMIGSRGAWQFGAASPAW